MTGLVSRTKQDLGYLIDVTLAASGKIRDNVEALGAEQVDSSVLFGSRSVNKVSQTIVRNWKS